MGLYAVRPGVSNGDLTRKSKGGDRKNPVANGIDSTSLLLSTSLFSLADVLSFNGQMLKPIRKEEVAAIALAVGVG